MTLPSAPFASQIQRPHVSSRSSHIQPVRLKTGGIRVLQGGQILSTKSDTETRNAAAFPQPIPLYRRLFYPSANEGSPPRILASSGTEQLDVQLYTLLALICRGFISPWYAKISRERTFFLEIVRVSRHVFRQLEARLVNLGHDDQQIDKLHFLCTSIPRILERHIQDYRMAKERCNSAYAAGSPKGDSYGISDFEAYFHSLQPHVAIRTSSLRLDSVSIDTESSEKVPAYLNADYLRAAIEALLRNFLPPEDYQAETERYVIREVILGIILAGIFNKVAQPWFLFDLIAKVLDRVQAKKLGISPDPSDSHKNIPEPTSKWQSPAGFLANLPILFYRLTILFATISLFVTTALASPYYRQFHFTSAGEYQVTTHLAKPSIDFAFMLVRARHDGRQVLDQLRWFVITFSSLLDTLVDR